MGFSLQLTVCVCVLFSIGIEAAPEPKPCGFYYPCYNRAQGGFGDGWTVSPWVYYNRGLKDCEARWSELNCVDRCKCLFKMSKKKENSCMIRTALTGCDTTSQLLGVG